MSLVVAVLSLIWDEVYEVFYGNLRCVFHEFFGFSRRGGGVF